MKRLDERDRELAQEQARRIERDDERKSGAPRRLARHRPRYSRFQTLARIHNRIANDGDPK